MLPVLPAGRLGAVCRLGAARLLRQGTGAARGGRWGQGPAGHSQVTSRGGGTGGSPERPGLPLGRRRPLRGRSLGERCGAHRPGVLPPRVQGREAALRLGPWARRWQGGGGVVVLGVSVITGQGPRPAAAFLGHLWGFAGTRWLRPLGRVPQAPMCSWAVFRALDICFSFPFSIYIQRLGHPNAYFSRLWKRKRQKAGRPGPRPAGAPGAAPG